MIRLVTDSAANLPPDLATQYNVTIVPLRVQIGANSYREGIDLSQEEFFRQLPNANPLPTTSQPTPMDFEEIFQEILGAGDEVLTVTLSSRLSGTYNSAHNALQTLGAARISVVDSKSASVGVSLLVLAAARMVAAGRARQHIVAELERLADELLLVLTLDTLEYLKRGGRIGGAAAFLGGLLRVKPVLFLKDGVIEPGERARSRSKAITQLIEMEAARFGNQPVWVGVAQAMADDVDQLETLARQKLNVQEMIRSNIGPVVATHTGPGTLGLAVMPAPKM